jgi:hypothetical protein
MHGDVLGLTDFWLGQCIPLPAWWCCRYGALQVARPTSSAPMASLSATWCLMIMRWVGVGSVCGGQVKGGVQQPKQ